MDEFEAMVNSLGETLVSYIGKDHLRRLSINIDPATYSADVEVCLTSDDFEAVMFAIERIGQVRQIFMDELSFDYVLTSPEACRVPEDQRQRELVFA